MRVEILTDAGALAIRAADLVCDVVRRESAVVLGLPTGETPIGAYRLLSKRAAAGETDFRQTTVFAVDEFLGAGPCDPGTNADFFREHLALPWKELNVPDTATPDPIRHIAGYGDQVRGAGGLDLCVLGIGANGHIAFNEPGSTRDSRARVVELTVESRAAHTASFGSLDAVPLRGMTLGVADLMESKAIVVLAQGAHKASIVARAVEGATTPDVPASWLQQHPELTWLVDEAAAALLPRRRT